MQLGFNKKRKETRRRRGRKPRGQAQVPRGGGGAQAEESDYEEIRETDCCAEWWREMTRGLFKLSPSLYSRACAIKLRQKGRDRGAEEEEEEGKRRKRKKRKKGSSSTTTRP